MGSFDQQAANLILGHRMMGLALAHGHALRIAADAVENRFGDQLVIENNIGVGERAEGFQRQQLGITRPCADEGDRAAFNRAGF